MKLITDNIRYQKDRLREEMLHIKPAMLQNARDELNV